MTQIPIRNRRGRITGYKDSETGSYTKKETKYTVDPNKKQIGRNVTKRRLDAEKETKPAHTEATKQPQTTGKSEKLPPNLRYPFSTIDGTQDFIKFSIFKYKRDTLVTRDENNLKSDLLGTILLPIPAQLVDSNAANYGPGNMNFMQERGLDAFRGLTSGDGESAGRSVNNMVAQLTGSSLVKDYFAKEAINSIGGNISLDQILARGSGQIINPNMELLFSGPTLRDFSYQFKFTPRFEKEAQTVRTIIKAFKRNMAPKGSAGGTFLKSPNIFEIQYVGKASDYLNRIKLCALKNIAMNYTADGNFTTYSDGAPISMNMTLSFTELTPVFNEDYESYDDVSDGVGY